MNGHTFEMAGSSLVALQSGALWWPEKRILTVSDMHLGKSDRLARNVALMLPPYETSDTLAKLDEDIAATGATTVVCLGDSFDDLQAAESLTDDERLWITRLQAGRRWVWIEGNHDPGPVDFGGTHLKELPSAPLTFRHIAKEDTNGEISGHFHPKANVRARGRSITRPCFLYDSNRVILPAYGTYTGGLRTESPALSSLMREDARAVLTGLYQQVIPMPRG